MNKRIIFSLAVLFIVVSLKSCDKDIKRIDVRMRIFAESPVVIYSNPGSYVAFCDAIKFEGKYYCVFREGENHAPYHDYHENGYLKILSSDDLKNWHEAMEIKDPEWDLRDPCFCAVGNRLYLYYGLYSFETPNPSQKTGLTKLEIYEGSLHIVNSEKIDIGQNSNLWLWKVYYYDGEFYGTAYDTNTPLLYVTSNDGVHFYKVSEIIEKGGETSLVEMGDKRRIAIIRNTISQEKSFMAISQPPYTSWTTYSLNEMIESPESFIYNDVVYAIGRSSYGMSMFKVDFSKKIVVPVYNFFACGDWGNSGYPGIIMEGDNVSVIYYAINPVTNETAIYQTHLHFSND